jgi:hypothetical protein
VEIDESDTGEYQISWCYHFIDLLHLYCVAHLPGRKIYQREVLEAKAAGGASAINLERRHEQ